MQASDVGKDGALRFCWSKTGRPQVKENPSLALRRELDRRSGGKLRKWD